ncbi:EAL and HDOD domain-containing protein [Aliidiomarina quisquiliarum]|uniref:EAL and HDOD domain-containing protein n=1 Tax=Aliidiomarina quisquiliarum TaxID=2938947 RepID=UPI00208E5BFA|nr:HDOD domain-containing protein [Aliidiomarina quisquiliarum]MCO4321070.1 HDOD domain-containing protein [Aliidiomarina quisquiliarum]
MAYSYIARQPILDRELKVHGYELLFRNSEENVFPNIDPDEATSKLLLQQHLMGDISTVCLGKIAFINFHTNTLLDRFPSFLPKENVYIEVLETVEITESLVKACQKSYELGYKIALDDHDFDEKWQLLLPYVSLIKVDIQQQSLVTLPERLQAFKGQNVALLAERVETQEEYEACLALGFDFFQGYFFERPEIIRSKSLAPQQLFFMQLLANIHQPNINFTSIADIIRNDLSLTYSLLKFVNSAAFHKPSQITDIHHAVVFVGEQEIKKYIALVALANVAHNQPEELVIKSLTRAHFMAELGRLSARDNHDNTCFMTGLLSLLDVLLQVPMLEILEQLPLSERINNAVLKREGHAGRLLRMVETYEAGNWPLLDIMATKMNLNHLDIGQCFISASNYTHALLDSTTTK